MGSDISVLSFSSTVIEVRLTLSTFSDIRPFGSDMLLVVRSQPTRQRVKQVHTWFQLRYVERSGHRLGCFRSECLHSLVIYTREALLYLFTTLASAVRGSAPATCISIRTMNGKEEGSPATTREPQSLGDRHA